MRDLYAIAAENGVVIERWPLTPPLDAVYFKDAGMPPIVVMATHLREEGAEYRTILAHELGHHFTSAGETVSSRLFSYGDLINVDRVEHRANKWAAEHLIPWDELRDALVAGLREKWELAEHFGVTEEMVEFRLRNLWCL